MWWSRNGTFLSLSISCITFFASSLFRIRIKIDVLKFIIVVPIIQPILRQISRLYIKFFSIVVVLKIYRESIHLKFWFIGELLLIHCFFVPIQDFPLLQKERVNQQIFILKFKGNFFYFLIHSLSFFCLTIIIKF